MLNLFAELGLVDVGGFAVGVVASFETVSVRMAIVLDDLETNELKCVLTMLLGISFGILRGLLFSISN